MEREDIHVYKSFGLLSVRDKLLQPPLTCRNSLDYKIQNMWAIMLFLRDLMKEDGEIVYELLAIWWSDHKVSNVFGRDSVLNLCNRQLKCVQRVVRKFLARRKLSRNLAVISVLRNWLPVELIMMCLIQCAAS